MSGSISVEVEVDVCDVLGEISTSELVAELAGRENDSRASDDVIFEDLYYALRDGDLEKAIKVINPLIEEKTGRMV